MKTYQLKIDDELLAEIQCENAKIGKNKWMVQLTTESRGLIATIYLGLDVVLSEKSAGDKSSPASK